MGGREGSRGYLYQAVVSVLQSLQDKDWKSVQVEPDSANDKVDILWEFNSGNEKVAQVKSSINNFSKADIIKWLEEICNDASQANEISLILIGSLSDGTKRFVNKLNEIETLQTDELKELEGIKDFVERISIHQENFDLSSLESKINNSLDIFLTEQGHTVNYYTRAMMVDALVNTFNKFSIQGQKVSREEFEQNLLDWVYFNFPQVQSSELIKKSLVVQFYLSKYIDFSTKVCELNPNFKSILEYKKQQLIELVRQIRDIKLPKKADVIIDEQTEALRRMLMVSSFGGSYVSNEIPYGKKVEISEQINNILGITVDESFFYVGELKRQEVGYHSLLGGPPIIQEQGTKQEKTKGQLFNKLFKKLDEYEEMIVYSKYLNKFQVIPLALKNEGLSYDEDIRVKIFIPKNVFILTKNNIRIPDFSLIRDFTGYGSYFNTYLRHHQDSKVRENINYLYKPYKSVVAKNNEKEIKEANENFKWYVGSFFNFDYFEDDAESNVLVYHFDKLNANEAISFPSFILVQASSYFLIRYEITSKKLGRINKGELLYKIESREERTK
ncbi:hypothetical protein G3A_17460 [Bacillus sp. 17376]|nr:hypothetical protein G3A_17460 [Bacillus sp. 17376]